MQIKTERLLIRELEEKDARDYFEIFGNPAIARYDDYEPIRESDADENIADIIAGYRCDKPEKEYGAELQEEGKIIGVLYQHAEEIYFFIGYHFNENYHGRGFAIEAVNAFVNHLESTSGREVRAIVDPENSPSIKLLGKLSFVFHEERKTEKEGGGFITELIYRKPRKGK